jgi:hemoglobin
LIVGGAASANGTMTVTASLYDRLGGSNGISDLVVEFYERVLNDPLLVPFFKHTSMQHLRTMQQEFFTIATGGPSEVVLPLKVAHGGRGIADKQYQRFVEHLLTTLEGRGLEPGDVDAIVDRLALEHDSIVDAPGQLD